MRKFQLIPAFLVLAVLAAARLGGAHEIRAALPAPYAARAISAFGVLTAIALAVLLDRLVRVFYWDGYLRRKRGRETPKLIEDLLTVALMVLGASLGLFFEAGVSLTGLLTASGATAIILGISLQAAIKDVFSGLSLNFGGSFMIGDWLTVYSEQFPEPIFGRVQGITWNSTLLHLTDGRRLIVPNHMMTTNPVLNHSRPPGPKEMVVEVPVANRFPAERAMSILLGEAYRTVAEKPFASRPEPDILIHRIEANAIVLRVRFYADPDRVDPDDVRSLMAAALHQAALRHGIPAPASRLEFLSASAERDLGAAEARDALARVPLFKDILGAPQLEALVSACKVRAFPADTVLIRQGETETSMFVILEGAARVSVKVTDGEARNVAVLAGGDIVGEMSLMTGASRAATVTSLTALRVIEVTKASIEPLFAAQPGLLERLGNVLALRQSGLSEIAKTESHEPILEGDILARMRRFFSRTFH